MYLNKNKKGIITKEIPNRIEKEFIIPKGLPGGLGLDILDDGTLNDVENGSFAHFMKIPVGSKIISVNKKIVKNKDEINNIINSVGPVDDLIFSFLLP